MSACGLDLERAPEDPAPARFAADVRAGLGGRARKALPPAYLYDALGTALFEAITQLPEYGVWRAERRVLERHAQDIAAHCPAAAVIELGSGSATKTRLLLEPLLRWQRLSYAAVDVSAGALAATRATLRELDGLDVRLVQADYPAGFARAAAQRPSAGRLLVLFLGGSLGNFGAIQALRCLQWIRRGLQPGDGLLLGVDLDKPAHRLLPAYDDPLGVTAAFDLNLLARMNRELGADFDLAGFRHEARFDARTRDVEMHLRALRTQQVRFAHPDLSIELRTGETIHTESSHKYRVDELDALAGSAGFRAAGHWRDEEWPFLDALYLAS
jgi:dimethylhistidine N-methyltransferase